MADIYMELILGHRSLHSGKICIVKLPGACEMIADYVEPAKRKACARLKLNTDEVSILDWHYLGEDVVFC